MPSITKLPQWPSPPSPQPQLAKHLLLLHLPQAYHTILLLQHHTNTTVDVLLARAALVRHLSANYFDDNAGRRVMPSCRTFCPIGMWQVSNSHRMKKTMAY
jgi:hypothetical protein